MPLELEGGTTDAGFFVLKLGCHVFLDLFPFSFGSGSSGGPRRAAGNGELGSGVTMAGLGGCGDRPASVGTMGGPRALPPAADLGRV